MPGASPISPGAGGIRVGVVSRPPPPHADENGGREGPPFSSALPLLGSNQDSPDPEGHRRHVGCGDEEGPRRTAGRRTARDDVAAVPGASAGPLQADPARVGRVHRETTHWGHQRFRRACTEDKRVPVRINTVAGDLVFLRGVINWACKWQDDDARYLMRDNVTRGFPLPVEKNPRRPVATADRYEKVRAVADQVTMAVGRGRHAPRQRSPL